MTTPKAVHYCTTDKTSCGRTFGTVAQSTDWDAVTCQTCRKVVSIQSAALMTEARAAVAPATITDEGVLIPAEPATPAIVRAVVTILHPCDTCGRPLARAGSDLCDSCATFGAGPYEAERAYRAAWNPRQHLIARQAARFRREGDAFMSFYRSEHNHTDYERAMRHYALAFNTEYR